VQLLYVPGSKFWHAILAVALIPKAFAEEQAAPLTLHQLPCNAKCRGVTGAKNHGEAIEGCYGSIATLSSLPYMRIGHCPHLDSRLERKAKYPRRWLWTWARIQLLNHPCIDES